MLSKLIGSKFYLIAAGAAAVAVAALWWYISSLQNNIDEAAKNLAASQAQVETLVQGVETQRTVITQMQMDVAQGQEAVQHLTTVANRQASELKDLKNRFNVSTASGRERDFEAIAIARPESVQRVINAGSSESARCMELASGAKRTPQEESATKRSEINSLCPSLANPNFVQ